MLRLSPESHALERRISSLVNRRARSSEGGWGFLAVLWRVLVVWLGVLLVAPVPARAGGSGLNTLVVVNQASTNSCELGNYYCEQRQIPPENVLRIYWTGGNILWQSNEFEAVLLQPLLKMVRDRGLTNQADYVVLSMDIPFQTRYGEALNSTTSSLFYGMKDTSGPRWRDVTNSYFASESSFRSARPASASGYSFLTTMITGQTLAHAKAVVDQGVAGDATYPKYPIVLAKSSDPVRNLRYVSYDNAILNARLCRNELLVRTNSDTPSIHTNLFGYQTGLANFSLNPKMFVPGAIADSLTSYGGIIFGPNGQTTLLAFLQAGAAGSYGTVTEPSAALDKFPDPRVYFYQSRGFSLAESYYQSLADPHEGLVVGEPLSSPYALAAEGLWTHLPQTATLSGVVNCGFRFTALDPEKPVHQADLYIDGKFQRTLTNATPQAGNLLEVTLNGYRIRYVVPANATLSAITTGLVAKINAPENQAATLVQAEAFGDRVQLQSIATNDAQRAYYFSVPVPLGPSHEFFRVRYLLAPDEPGVSTLGWDEIDGFRLRLDSAECSPVVVEASTNLADWAPIYTNRAGGLSDFTDPASRELDRRFYRVSGPANASKPSLRLNEGRDVQITSLPGLPCVVEASGDLVDWAPVYTNAVGGHAVFQDPQAATSSRRFYRAYSRLQIPAAPPEWDLVSLDPDQGVLMKVQSPLMPFVVEMTTNLTDWRTVHAQRSVRRVETTATASRGTAAYRGVQMHASRAALLESLAQGRVQCWASGTLQVGAWLSLSLVKTNGAHIRFSVTNQVVAGTLLAMCQQMTNLVNTSPALQGDDGVYAEDLAAGAFGSARFSLVARSPGHRAADIQMVWSGSGNFVTGPVGPTLLEDNEKDLQPRNHLFLTSGTASLNHSFDLDTRELPDGFHDLEVVGYEGTHVRTQSRLYFPMRVANSSLDGRVQIQQTPGSDVLSVMVSSNTNALKSIQLYTTGGLLATATNQPSATFPVSAQYLGAGLHPFYAILETPTGGRFRTPIRYLRIFRP